MLHPETQLDIVRARHSELLQSARTGELATRLAAAPAEERRTFLARLRCPAGAEPHVNAGRVHLGTAQKRVEPR